MSIDTTTAKPPIEPENWAAIRLFAMDVDGILTDGGVYVSSTGEESKRFSVLDGLGLARAREAGIILAWISGRQSGATTKRGEELRIPHVIQGRGDKGAVLQELITHLDVPSDEVCYMGDDDIDVGAMLHSGIGVTVPTGMPAALAAADYITKLPAGNGAVREICDLIVHAKALHPKKEVPSPATGQPT